jgi:hypothetical protein
MVTTQTMYKKPPKQALVAVEVSETVVRRDADIKRPGMGLQRVSDTSTVTSAGCNHQRMSRYGLALFMSAYERNPRN